MISSKPTLRAAGLSLIWLLANTIHATKRYGAMSLPSPPDALIPRYLVDNSFPLVRRSGSCGKGMHNCDDTGNPDQCCSNTSYCYVNKKGDARCCPIGSNCVNDSPCKSEQYYCTTVITTSSGPAQTQTGCCPRKCPATSNYLCAADLGGNCCPYDSECQKGGNCISTASQTTGLLTAVPEGCTTSQYKCSDGAGCCDNNQACTEVSGTGFCASGVPTETGVPVADDSSSSNLSQGAMAGIGVGAVVGGSILIGLLTWMCIRKRRGLGIGSSRSRSYYDYTDGSTGRQDRNYNGTQDGSANDGRQNAAADPNNNNNGPPSSRPALPNSGGLTQDYFGPDAVVGPFTVSETPQSPGADRAVPAVPNQPGDIAVPVEIDSTARNELHGASLSNHNRLQSVETIEGRFELDGGDYMPVVGRSKSRSSSIGPERFDIGIGVKRDDEQEKEVGSKIDNKGDDIKGEKDKEIDL